MKLTKFRQKNPLKMRWHVVGALCLMNGYRVGAEIGVSTGRFSRFLCGLSPDFMMLGVDEWIERPANTGPGQETYIGWNGDRWYRDLRAFSEQYLGGRLTLRRQDSVEAAKYVHDASLDFVFIDAEHSYEGCTRDIAAWDPKVRKGGIVCGHDYSPNWPGVVRAVDETGKKIATYPDAVWVYQK